MSARRLPLAPTHDGACEGRRQRRACEPTHDGACGGRRPRGGGGLGGARPASSPLAPALGEGRLASSPSDPALDDGLRFCSDFMCGSVLNLQICWRIINDVLKNYIIYYVINLISLVTKWKLSCKRLLIFGRCCILRLFFFDIFD